MEDYLFACARVSVLENGMIGREKLERLIAAPNIDRCVDLLTEYGVDVKRDPETNAFLREDTLLERLRRAYAEVQEGADNADFTRIFRWQYDCNNIKAAIKCVKRGVDPAGMLFDFGNIEAQTVLHCAEKNEFENLEETFASAAREASDTFAKTGNPQWVDLILDRACYAAMLADAGKNAFARQIVAQKIDLTNLLSCLRLLRMKSEEAGKMMLRDSFIEGGELGKGFFEVAYGEGEESFWEMVRQTDYSAFAGGIGVSSTLTEIERAADNFWIASVRQAKWLVFGQEVLLAYLASAEYEVRNLRIVLAGVEAGLSPKIIGERIRLNEL